MRNYKFRGQRKTDNEWVYGSLLIDISQNRYLIVDDMSGSINDVIPETIGQFTGLSDQNKKEIYKGDILKILPCKDTKGNYQDIPKSNGIAIVKWGMCAWLWETTFIVGGMEDKRYITFPEAWCNWKCEVIGNIHDNPELIGGDRS